MLSALQLEQAVAAFVTFFVLINAPGVAPIFVSLTAPGGSAYARRMALKSVFIAGLILFFFAFAATTIIGHFNIRVLLTLLTLSRWVLFVLNGQLLDLILRLLTVDLLYVLDPLLSLFLELNQAQRSS